MQRNLALLFVLIPFATACGDDAGHGGHVAADAGPTDQDVATDALMLDQDASADAPATPTDGGGAVPRLNDCTAAEYEDRSGGADTDRVVRPRGTTGYTPRCLIIRAGQSVTFEMNFTTHPLVPGIPHGPTAGATTPNPIARRDSGMTYTVAFPGAGYFPFYCNVHGHVGMAGVVRVMP